MNADQLRQLQAPIKAHYKEQPESARHASRATLLPDRPSVRVGTPFARYDAGLHPKAGGNGSEACCVIFQTLRTPQRLSATLQCGGAALVA